MAGLSAVILAAGQGTRMKSGIPKVLHPLAGRPMIQYPIDLARAVGADPIVVVVGHGAQQVMEAIGTDGPVFVTQSPQLGSGHAVGCARDVLRDRTGQLLILYGDVPFLSPETVRGMVDHHRSKHVPLTILVASLENPTGYGRILRDHRGAVIGVVEEADATEVQRKIGEINTGTYCARPRDLFEAIESLERDNAQGEYYLTDVVRILSPRGVSTYEAAFPEEFLGINDRVDLARAEEIIQWRIRRRWMSDGVSMRDPATVYLDFDVQIGRDTLLEPQVSLRGHTRIGEGGRIAAGCWIEDSVLEENVTVLPSSVITGSRIESGVTIGPFAHLRPGNVVESGARIGNFVELKKAKVGRGSKASHLSYLGDTEIGRGVNIGAGTITCNYDGFAKHRTVIEDDVFVGSDTQLVAPVRVGKGAEIGAGSTITKDVPPDSLAVSRARQVNLEGRARRRRMKKGGGQG